MEVSVKDLITASLPVTPDDLVARFDLAAGPFVRLEAAGARGFVVSVDVMLLLAFLLGVSRTAVSSLASNVSSGSSNICREPRFRELAATNCSDVSKHFPQGKIDRKFIDSLPLAMVTSVSVDLMTLFRTLLRDPCGEGRSREAATSAELVSSSGEGG